eukprot:5927077-Ditylum_brightwellii.AAC.1
MQGDPMAMFLYALGVLPIIKQLKHHQLDVESLTREISNCKHAIKAWFQELCQIGPPLGYFPEPDKSILVTALLNLELAKNYFQAENFKIKTGYHYLGGHIGEGKDDFVTEKVLDWVDSVKKILPLVRRNPQTVHT